MTKITILGTSCMVPTKERSAPGTFIEVDGVGILFDCGEGTQRQMNIAGISRAKVRYIFITHWHADHTAGLLGLIQTIGSSAEQAEIDLFGPIGTKDMFRNLMNSSVFENRVNIQVHELNCPEKRIILKKNDFSISAINIQHGTPCLAFRLDESAKRKINLSEVRKAGIPEGPLLSELQQGMDVTFKGKTYRAEELTSVKKGKSFTYVTDTMFVESAIEISRNSDILLCEATYAKSHEQQANDRFHLTSEQAGQIASMSNADKLILTHFSQRYKTLEELRKAAEDVFPNVELAYDLMSFKL